MNTYADKGLTYLFNLNNESIYTYNYSLGFFGIFFVIPSALLGTLIVKGLLKLQNKFSSSETSDQLWFLSVPFFEKLFKILGKGAHFAGKALLAVWRVVFTLIGTFVKAISPSSTRGGGKHTGGLSGGPRHSGDNRKEVKKQAEFQARQKQKEADVAWKHADKQARYNVNTHHFDKRYHRADAKQKEANEASKKARNL
ncbi:cell envelope integrity protein TolA [Lentibacillus kimchii]